MPPTSGSCSVIWCRTAPGQIIVNTTLSVAAAILTESALSFLGFGVNAIFQPTWGNLLSNSQDLLSTYPFLVWFPGLAIVLTVSVRELHR